VGAVEVVFVEVAVEVALEGGQPGYERAGEAGAPAFLEDRLLQALVVPVRLWPAGPDAPLRDGKRGERRGEAAGAVLGAVVPA